MQARTTTRRVVQLWLRVLRASVVLYNRGMAISLQKSSRIPPFFGNHLACRAGVVIDDGAFMAAPDEAITEELLRQAAGGSESAIQQLFQRYRERLKLMVAARLDPRVAKRVDPSDVVQDVLLDAHRRLADYVAKRPIPFYPWLRQLAWDRLIEQHRRHIRAKRRTVQREDTRDVPLSDESATRLASRLVKSGHGASDNAIRNEMRVRVREALLQLSSAQREVLLMRHVEQMSTSEIAAAVGIAEGTVKSRVFRALEELRQILTIEQ